YYGYSNEKASQALKILSKDQINFIKQRLDTGGTK
ncbi:DNA polymerase, partial [bacterium]|nr:DNA polymerase [bacterium]